MNTLEMIKYLIQEIEEEQKYNEEFEKAKEEAEEKAKGTAEYWWRLIPVEYQYRNPRKSVIKGNAKKIRQLLLKLY